MASVCSLVPVDSFPPHPPVTLQVPGSLHHWSLCTGSSLAWNLLPPRPHSPSSSKLTSAAPPPCPACRACPWAAFPQAPSLSGVGCSFSELPRTPVPPALLIARFHCLFSRPRPLTPASWREGKGNVCLVFCCNPGAWHCAWHTVRAH